MIIKILLLLLLQLLYALVIAIPIRFFLNYVFGCYGVFTFTYLQALSLYLLVQLLKGRNIKIG